MPATLEERVAYLEGKVEEHSRGYADIREGLQSLEQRLTFLDQKVDRSREELAARIDASDHRLSGRIDSLDQKVSTQFRWLVGIQFMVLLAVIGALLGK
ncbi:MAG: hypothetical protein AB1411_09210 [Nitrospirota bacterium]